MIVSRPRLLLLRYVLSAILVLATMISMSGCLVSAEEPAPEAAATTSDAATEGARPSPSATPKPLEPTSGATKGAQGSTAVFKHFKVTVSRIDYGADPAQALMLATVCVTSLPASYQGNRIRISWDPWSVTAGLQSAAAGYQGAVPANVFASDGDYRVGACARGRIPFELAGHLDTVRYANAVGDQAVWDADHLGDRPTTSRTSQLER